MVEKHEIVDDDEQGGDWQEPMERQETCGANQCGCQCGVDGGKEDQHHEIDVVGSFGGKFSDIWEQHQ